MKDPLILPKTGMKDPLILPKTEVCHTRRYATHGGMPHTEVHPYVHPGGIHPYVHPGGIHPWVTPGWDTPVGNTRMGNTCGYLRGIHPWVPERDTPVGNTCVGSTPVGNTCGGSTPVGRRGVPWVGREVYPGWEEGYLPTMVPGYTTRVCLPVYIPGYTSHPHVADCWVHCAPCSR